MDPSAGHAFYGRKDVLAVLDKRLDAFRNGFRQNIGITGHAHVGKTMLVAEIARRAHCDDMLVVPFSCHEAESFENFSQRWLSEIIFSFYRSLKKPLPDDFRALFRDLRPMLPKTLRQMKLVKKLTLQLRYGQAFQELLGLSGTLCKESGKKILFILDDFERLSELPLNDPFAQLGNEMMMQKETMFVVTSGRIQLSRSIFTERLSLLFGNFEVIQLRTFGFEEVVEMIDKTLTAPAALSGCMRRFLIRLTDGNPYYLRVLLARIKLEIQANGPSVDERVNRAIVSELYQRGGRLNQLMRTKIFGAAQGRSWTTTADLMYAISIGHKKLLKISRFLHIKSNEAKKGLERLAALEMVEKHGALHLVRDPLLRFWLAKVYSRGRFMSERAPQANAYSFAEDVRANMRSFEDADQRELSKRIEELFRKFRNDVVHFDEQRLRCPSFTEVAARPTNGRVFPVFAKNAQTRWLCQILEAPVTEDDIQTFHQDLKRLRSPVHKRLVVGLRGIDLNAKLLAKETKIQYLDLRYLNFLMDVFDQPKVFP
jgi:hypothetical protein